MKLVVLLLLFCCAVALARPDGSKEVKPKHGSKEHSGDSKEKDGGSSDGSSEGSSNESGRKDGGDGITIPGIILPEPSIQQVESSLDHVVEIVTSYLGPRPVNSVRELVALIQSNPIGSLVWNLGIHPYLQNIANFQSNIISTIQQSVSSIFNSFPFLHSLFPLGLPGRLIHCIATILSHISKIFSNI